MARYKYPPAWVSAQALFTAMQTVDSDSGLSRGWLVVSPSTVSGGAPAPLPPGPASPARLARGSALTCLSGLATDSAEGVAACMSTGVAPLPGCPGSGLPAATCPSPPPPCAACPGNGAAAAWTLWVLTLGGAAYLGWLLRAERAAAAALRHAAASGADSGELGLLGGDRK